MLRGEKCNIPLSHMRRTTPCLLQIFKNTGFRNVPLRYIAFREKSALD